MGFKLLHVKPSNGLVARRPSHASSSDAPSVHSADSSVGDTRELGVSTEDASSTKTFLTAPSHSSLTSEQYDLGDKGYFDQADLEAALDPATVENVTERAHQIMSFWDANSDGKVTVDEVISGIAVGGYVGGEKLNADATIMPAV
jgi:hypothetical protein